MLSSIESLNRAITYKPNYSVELVRETDIYRHMEPMLILNVVARLPDSTTREHRLVDIKFRQMRPLECFMSDEHVYQWVGDCLADMEIHERDEWFRINTQMVRNPHKN